MQSQSIEECPDIEAIKNDIRIARRVVNISFWTFLFSAFILTRWLPTAGWVIVAIAALTELVAFFVQLKKERALAKMEVENG